MDMISNFNYQTPMTPAAAARSAATKEFSQDRYVSRRPWLVKPPRIRLAMIAITYRITDAEGDVITCHTWSIGITPKSAMRCWFTRRPDIRPEDAEYRVVTESKARVRELAQGEKVEVPDPLLASLG